MVCLILIWSATIIAAYFWGQYEEEKKMLANQAIGQQEATFKAWEQTQVLYTLQTKKEEKIDDIINQKSDCRQLFDTDIADCLPK